MSKSPKKKNSLNSPFSLLEESHKLDSFSQEITAGFTTGSRKDKLPGSLAFQPAIAPQRTLDNRRDFCLQWGLSEQSFRSLNQCHGDRVIATEDYRYKQEPIEADALISREKRMILSVFLADCVPLLFFDPVHKAIGAVHGGWRGTAAGIAEKTLKAMHCHYGTLAADLHVAIGPAIDSCCYVIGDEVSQIFQKEFSFSSEVLHQDRGVMKLDLKKTHSLSLQKAGVKPENISISSTCTCCGDKNLPSYRKSGASAGRFSAFIFMH